MSVEQATNLIHATGKGFSGRKAAGYRLIVECDGLNEKTVGGIIVDSSDKHEGRVKAINTGLVVSVGDQAYKSTHLGGQWVEVGQRVKFQQYGGDLYSVDGIWYRTINDEDVFEVFL